MRQVSVESFVTFFGLMRAAVWATANLVDSRYLKNSSIWILAAPRIIALARHPSI
jgi:hypothetical protein